MADQPAADPLLDKLVLLPPPPVKHLAQHTEANMGGEGGGMGTEAGAEQVPASGAIDGAALFRGDRLVGFAEELEAQGLRWALAPVQGRNVWVPVDGGGFEIRVWRSHPRLAVQQAQGRLELRIQVDAEADLLELADPVDSDSPAALAQLEALAAQYIEAEIAAGVAYAESLRTDPLRAGLCLYRWHPDLWQQLKEDWPQPLADAVHVIEARVRIYSTGLLRRNAPASQTKVGGP
jgi:spore germination protein KC